MGALVLVLEGILIGVGTAWLAWKCDWTMRAKVLAAVLLALAVVACATKPEPALRPSDYRQPWGCWIGAHCDRPIQTRTT